MHLTAVAVASLIVGFFLGVVIKTFIVVKNGFIKGMHDGYSLSIRNQNPSKK